MAKLLYVVHRYPNPETRPDIAGGSEVNVRRMAEESVRQGHDVSVLTDEHGGDYNGVKVFTDRTIVQTPFDLIICHGSCSCQDFILYNAQAISLISPIYYMIIQPKQTDLIENGMKYATGILWATSADKEFLDKTPYAHKGREIVYGIDNIMGDPGFKERYGIKTKRMILSAGGFLPHKGFEGLVKAFYEAALPDTTLVLMGYDNRYGSIPAASKTVVPIIGASQQDVFDAMYEADLYVMNSSDEGYGLVLLEAMHNMCPWVARPIAAGKDLAAKGFGQNFNNHDELVYILRTHKATVDQVEPGARYVGVNHMAYDSVKSIIGAYLTTIGGNA